MPLVLVEEGDPQVEQDVSTITLSLILPREFKMCKTCKPVMYFRNSKFKVSCSSCDLVWLCKTDSNNLNLVWMEITMNFQD